MVTTSWCRAVPTIMHQHGISCKLPKGQANLSPDVPNYCMRGIPYVAYVTLQAGKSYKAHVHGDHEEVYYVIAGHGTIIIDGKWQSIQDGDVIFIPTGDIHSISSTGEEFSVFLAFATQVPEDKASVQGEEGY